MCNHGNVKKQWLKICLTACLPLTAFLHLTISGLKFDAKEVVVDVLLTLLDKVSILN